MKSHLPTLSLIVLMLAASVDAKAQDNSRRATTGEAWFGDEGSTESTPPVVPNVPRAAAPGPVIPERAPVSGHSNATAARHPWGLRNAPSIVPQMAPIRYEPDDSSVHLLIQNGVMPYDSLVRYQEAGWWGWPRPYGYYREVGVAPIYSPVCDRPCMTQVRRGSYQFALSRPGGPIVPVAGPRTISEPSIVRAHYVDRSDQRTAGVLIGVIGAIGGLVMMVGSVHDEQQCDGYSCTTRSTVEEGWAVAGVGVFVGSIAASIVLINQHDEAQLSISPLRLPPPNQKFDALHSSSRALAPQGASATLVF